jgi:hypothetical protein
VPGGGGWGGGGWGGSGWGGGSGVGALQGALAVSENVIRVYFSHAPYYSGLLDPGDASNPEAYSILPVAGTVGLDGTQARSVSAIVAAVGGDPNSIDVTLDRPLTAWPAQYQVATLGLVTGAPPSTTPIPDASTAFPAVYRQIVAAVPDALIASRDFANPQTAADQTTSQSSLLGSYPVDDSGDYAFDEGLASYKKRVLRRLITRKNGFAHLPGYGVGVPTYGKRLQKAGVRATIAADAEAQISQEPETDKVSVVARVDRSNPGLVYFIVTARTKSGQDVRFAAGPFPAVA